MECTKQVYHHRGIDDEEDNDEECVDVKDYVHNCDPPPRNESQCAKPTFAVARNLLQGCENVNFEILVVTA